MNLPPLAWTPRHDQLVVRPLEASSRTAGGLITPEAHQEAPQQGLVMAVGTAVSSDLHAGQVVAYGRFAGVPFEDPKTGHKLLVMRDTECILARSNVDLTECTAPSGRTVIHEAGQTCQYCPTPELDRLRQELRASHQADLGTSLDA